MIINLNRIITCRRCQYAGTLETYKPSLSAYSDIRCPQCKSTNNEWNSEYQKEIFKGNKK